MTTAQQRVDSKARRRDVRKRYARWRARSGAGAILVPLIPSVFIAFLLLFFVTDAWPVPAAALVATLPASFALLGGSLGEDQKVGVGRLWLVCFAIALLGLAAPGITRRYTAARRSEACMQLAATVFSHGAATSRTVTCRYASP